MASTSLPHFAFGVIADVQYADVEDGYNFTRTSLRYYRTALKMLGQAVDSWNTDKLVCPQFVLQLGDAIDGKNKHIKMSDTALQTVLNEFSKFKGNVFHIWGNHEYYNFTRQELLNSGLNSGREHFSIPVCGKTYYSAIPHPKFRILALDCYEISKLASPKDSSEYALACEYMRNNGNEDQNSCEGLTGVCKRFVQYNGALGERQIQWMKNNLQEAELMQQNVIIIGMAIKNLNIMVWRPSVCPYVR